MSDVLILSAARTPIGRFGGAFRDIHPAQLGAIAAQAAIQRAGLEAKAIDDIWMGHARQAGCGPNPARQVGHFAGVPHTVPAQTVNKACASGLQAIVSGAQSILLEDAHAVLVGGMESMSRTPYMVDASAVRWGHRMGDVQFVDGMYRDGFRCPLSGLLMGETAEVLAKQYGISRAESDRFAAESQQRTRTAMSEGRFSKEIVEVPVTDPKGRSRGVLVDEHPRPDTTVEQLSQLPLVFPGATGDGIVTAGNSSGITDGAAAMVLASERFADAHGLKPLARIRAWTAAGVDPRIMGIGPVPAMQKLFSKLSMNAEDFDLVEINEAFAAQVLAVLRDVPVSSERLNVNGGAIALGHPIGCTGTRIVVTLLHELIRRGREWGLASLCVSGGMGVALAIERV